MDLNIETEFSEDDDIEIPPQYYEHMVLFKFFKLTLIFFKIKLNFH